MGQDQSATKQGHDFETLNLKNQSQVLQRQLLEQQIAENAARKEVKPVDLLVVYFDHMHPLGDAFTVSKAGST